MRWRNTPGGFGAVSKAFHWIMALLVIGLLCVGLWMDGIPNTDFAFKIRVYDLHKSVGISVLLLVLARLFWHVYAKRPDFVAGMAAWERFAARAAHVFLYLAMIFMPLTGWMMSSAMGRPVKVFGLGPLPDLVAQDERLGAFFATVHWALGWALIAAIAVHTAAALKHHFINRDATLRRMLPFAKE